jgi:hypothetical protein
MKKIILCIALFFIIQSNLHAQEAKPVQPHKQFMQITTVESIISGGLGRSKIIITHADGTQSENDLENLFSLVGINFGNIKDNEDKIVRTLKKYTDQAWEIDKVTSFTLSPSDNGQGIFMTRYLLSKPE